MLMRSPEINGIPSRLVANVPYEIPVARPIALSSSILKVLDIVPETPPAVFQEDEWDFREFLTYHQSYDNVIKFKNAPAAAKNHLKFHALWLLDGIARVSTVSRRIRRLSSLLTEAIDRSFGKRYETITTESVLSVLDSTEVMGSGKVSYARFFEAYFSWLKDNGVVHLVDCEALKNAVRAYKQEAKHEETKHYPDIPQPLYAAIRDRMELLLYDKKAPLNHRMLAGMVLISSQTGLRHSETPALKVNCREQVMMPDGSERTVINYWQIKCSHKIGRPDLQKTICTDLANRAIDVMLKLRKRIVPKGGGDFLAVLEGMDGRVPISLIRYGNLYKFVIGKYVSECERDWPDIKRVLSDKRKRDRLYSIPKLHSFRVHFISSLYKAGVPIPYIEHLVSHDPGQVQTCYYGGVETPQNELLDE